MFLKRLINGEVLHDLMIIFCCLIFVGVLAILVMIALTFSSSFIFIFYPEWVIMAGGSLYLICAVCLMIICFKVHREKKS